jgi:hypothetical protein
VKEEAGAIVVLEEEDKAGVKEEDRAVGSVNELDVTVSVVKEEEVPVAKWWPSVTLPHELKDTISIWVDGDGLLYFHQPSGQDNDVLMINRVINCEHHTTPTMADLENLIQDEPCIALKELFLN